MLDVEHAGAALWVEDLNKVYGDGTPALRGLSPRIPAGCFFGLLGPNRSGKSALIGMVCGLVRAPAARIWVFGHDAIADAQRARLLLGVAPQDLHLDRFLTARAALVNHGRYFGLGRLSAGRRADELLEVFDLVAKVRMTPNRLSGGMRRRLRIARALVQRPRRLILDEPTAGVDLARRHELWAYLRRLRADADTTVLLTAHDIEEAHALCGRIAFIRDGRLLAEGTADALAARFGGADLETAYLQAMRP